MTQWCRTHADVETVTLEDPADRDALADSIVEQTSSSGTVLERDAIPLSINIPNWPPGRNIGVAVHAFAPRGRGLRRTPTDPEDQLVDEGLASSAFPGSGCPPADHRLPSRREECVRQFRFCESML